jgi:putative transposase
MTTTIAPTAPISPTVTLTARQRACVEQIARRQTNAQRLVRRAKMLLAMETGANNCQLARQMNLHRGTVRAWRRRWGALPPKLEQLASEGGRDKVLTTVREEALTDILRSGTPATLTAEQIVQMVAVACENPAEAGRPSRQWTPREVADEVIQRGIVETSSTRSVGRFFKSGGLTASSGGGLAQRPARCPRSLCRPSSCCVGCLPARTSLQPARGACHQYR